MIQKKEDQKKKYKITESMFQDMFRNLKADNNIQPVKIFHECMNCTSTYVSTTCEYYKDYKDSLDILNIFENMQYILPEFIFLAYLKSIMEYDSSTYYPYNNNDIQQIIETVGIDSKSNFLNHITLFKITYNINYLQEKTLNIIDNYFNFQANFFNFLNHYSMINNTTTDFSYAIPRTIAPIFIHIINAWNYSPISNIKKNIPIDKKGKKMPFNKFIEKVQKEYSNNFKPDNAYQLFTKYFLYFFFASTYITPLVKKQNFLHHFEYSPNDARLLRDEWNRYDKILYDINESIPFLALKRIFVIHAYELYKLNTTYILTLQTDCTDIEDITISSENFINELEQETNHMINTIRNFMNNNLSKSVNGKKFKIQPLTITYFESLQNIFESYKLNIETLIDKYYSFLFNYIYFDHSTISTVFNSTPPLIDSKPAILYSMMPDYNPLEPQPNKYKNNDETYQEIIKFSAHISEFIQKAVAKHEATFSKTYPCKKNFNAIDSFCRELEKIKGFINTLKKNINNNPPIQKYTFPKYETTYDSFIYEMKIATNTYECLFNAFYDKLTSLANKNPEVPLWHTLHLCIANNAESFEKLFEPS